MFFHSTSPLPPTATVEFTHAVTQVHALGSHHTRPLTVNLLHAVPTAKVEKRLLSPLAPVASAINGVSIILENDVDSSKAKYSFLLLSQPRGYYAGMDSCLSMGDGMLIVLGVPIFSLVIRPFVFARHRSFIRPSTRRIHLHPGNSRCEQSRLIAQQQRRRSTRSLWLLSVLGFQW